VRLRWRRDIVLVGILRTLLSSFRDSGANPLRLPLNLVELREESAHALTVGFVRQPFLPARLGAISSPESGGERGALGRGRGFGPAQTAVIFRDPIRRETRLRAVTCWELGRCVRLGLRDIRGRGRSAAHAKCEQPSTGSNSSAIQPTSPLRALASILVRRSIILVRCSLRRHARTVSTTPLTPWSRTPHRSSGNACWNLVATYTAPSMSRLRASTRSTVRASVSFTTYPYLSCPLPSSVAAFAYTRLPTC